LIPSVVDLCKGHKSKLTGEPIYVVAAGGIYDGRGLAAALAWGAQAVWVGTRFVCAKEAGAPPRHQQAIINAGFHDTIRTLVFTGRPMRVIKNDYIMQWENDRIGEMKELLGQGVLPYTKDVEERTKQGGEITPEDMKRMTESRPLLMGQCAAAVKEIKPALVIVNEMIRDAVVALRTGTALITPIKSKL